MKRKLLLAATFVASALGMRAQTDVTSTYLTNADFSQTTALTVEKLYGYGKDGSPYGFQTVDGWTSVVLNGDNSNNNFPNSGMGGGVISYGSTTLLQGGGKAAPSADPDGNSGNSLGFFGVWGCGGYYYQNVTLAAGKYTLTFPIYNQSGTQANTTYTGFFPTSGTNQTVAINTTVGSWVKQTVSFTLVNETAGQIRIGYLSTGNGSGANPMLFFDGVKIEFTAVVVKDVLSAAISAATTANATLNSSDLATAISTAQGVYDNENATQEEVNATAATLNTATELAMSAAGDVTDIFLTNAALSSTDGWTAYVSDSFRDYGNGLIGDYTVRFKAATIDDTHLETESCFGFECRWSTNYASYYQTTNPVPAGVYKFSYDVQNVNGSTTSASYNNLFYAQVGSTKYADNSTEWMNGSSNWTTHSITVTVNEASPITFSLGYGTGSNNISADNTPALYVSHVKMTYKSFLAGAKETWDEAVEAAGTAKTECANVTGEELTALNEELAKAEPTTVAGYNEATEAIEAAIATFTAAKSAYDAYAEIRSVAEALGVTPGDTPANAAAAPAATHALNVAVYNATTAENIFDVTEVYAPSWSDMSTSSGQHWSGDTNISYPDNWSGNANTTTRTATVTLPAGSYILMSAGRGSANTVPTMSANGTTVTFASNGDMGIGINKLGAASFDPEDAVGFAYKSGAAENTGTGWEWRYIPVTLAEETAVTVTQTLTRLSGSAWGSFSDFRIMKVGVVATTEDYTALNSAISDAEAKTLGFEDGEYAPYNNVVALKALAAANAINQTETNDQETVQAVTAALTSAIWTANSGDVEAIYNGHFAEANGTNPMGWTRSNGAWGQQITSLEASTGAETSTAWYYNTEGAWEYGKDGVYKMPLAADQTYKLTFKYRSHAWGSNNWMKASVLNDSDEGLADVKFAQNVNNVNFVTAIAYFTTGTAGNYILSLTQSGNTHLTDVSLVKVASATIEISENANTDVSNETYADVTLTRTIKADTWNTFVVPFDLSNDELKAAFGDDVAVAEFSENSDNAENVTVEFNTMETPAITANTPVLLKGNAGTSFDFSGKLIKTGEAKVAGKNIDFVGTYAASTDIAPGDYFISGNQLYKSAGTTKVAGTRAYLKVKTADAKIRLVIDEEATVIEGIAADAVQNGKVYDLSGRMVKNPTKGLYIMNGKKYIVK